MDMHTMCKKSREGIGLSAINLSDVRHTSAAAICQRGVALCKQAGEALGTSAAGMHAPCYRESIIHQVVFAPEAGWIEECRRIIPESQHLGNLVTQTHKTVDKIEALISQLPLLPWPMPALAGRAILRVAEVAYEVRLSA